MNERKAQFKGLDRSVRLAKIVTTATELFHRKGYQATTLDDVAGKLGLSKAALYHYVSSKQKLLSIIYSQAFETIFDRIREISAMTVSPREKLRLIMREHIEHIIIGNLPMFSVFFAEENQLPAKDFQKIREQKRQYTDLIQRVIEEGIADGSLKDVNPRLQAYAILGLCNWLYQWYKPQTSPFSPEQIVEHFTALLESGYLAPDPDRTGEAPGRRAPAGKMANEEAIRHYLDELKKLCGKLDSLLDDSEQ